MARCTGATAAFALGLLALAAALPHPDDGGAGCDAGGAACGSAALLLDGRVAGEDADLALLQLSAGSYSAEGVADAKKAQPTPEEVAFCMKAAPGSQGTIKDGNKVGAVMNLANRSRAVPGDIVEAGVMVGGGSLPILFFLACTGDMDGRLFHFFDTWEGLPPATEAADEGFKTGAYKMGYDRFLKNARVFREKYNEKVLRRKDGQRPSPRALAWDDVWEKSVRIHKGLFADTMPQALTDRSVALLLCDGDMYASSRDCLSSGGGRVVPGGWIYHDDYYTFKGNFEAVREWRKDHAASRQRPISLVPRAAYQISTLYQEGLKAHNCVPPGDNRSLKGTCNGVEVEAGYWQI